MLEIPNYGHVLVALSGGADSVALALLAKQCCARVTAAHVEHGIRAEASKRDMAFVQEFCKRHEIPLHTVCLDIPAMAKANSTGLETAAREARYAFLQSVKDKTGADVIATAHHMDDQMETVLMHLFRGSGTHGLEGMREKNGDIVRPLLGYTKAQLVEYLAQLGESFCEDETNRQDITPRNILRNRAIPQILSAYPRAFGSKVSPAAYHMRKIFLWSSNRTNGFITDSFSHGNSGIITGKRETRWNVFSPSVLTAQPIRLKPRA